MKLKMAAGAFGGCKWKSTYYALDTYKWDEIGVNGYYPGRLLLPAPYTINFRVPGVRHRRSRPEAHDPAGDLAGPREEAAGTTWPSPCAMSTST